MIPLRSITSRTITAPASLVRRPTRASMTTPALKLGWKVDGVSPMGCSALADIAAQTPESATHLAQEPAQSAVSTNIVGYSSGGVDGVDAPRRHRCAKVEVLSHHQRRRPW